MRCEAITKSKRSPGRKRILSYELMLINANSRPTRRTGWNFAYSGLPHPYSIHIPIRLQGNIGESPSGMHCAKYEIVPNPGTRFATESCELLVPAHWWDAVTIFTAVFTHSSIRGGY